MRVAGYCRVSTEEQASEGFSIDAQLKAIKDCCLKMDWTLVKIYEDPGESAATLDRAGLLELLDDADIGSFDLVLVTDHDRVARDVADFFTIRKRLEASKVAITTTREPNLTSFSSGAVVLDAVRAAIAEEERRKIIQRTKAGMTEAKRQGKHLGRPSSGFLVRNGELVPTEQGQRVIEMLQINPKLRPSALQRELGLADYKTAWSLLQAAKKYVEA